MKRNATNNAFRRCLAAGLLSALLLGSLQAATAGQGVLDRLRGQVSNLSRNIDRKRQEVRQSQQQEQRLSQRFQVSQERLETAEERLARAEARLEAARRAVEEATRRLEVAEENLQAAQRSFGQRLHHLYKEGPVTYLDVLAGANSLDEYLDREYLVQRIVSQDAELLGRLRDAYDEVEREREELLRQEQEVATAQIEIQRQVAELQQETERHAELLRQARTERSLLEQQLQELEEDSAAVQRQIEAELRRRGQSPPPGASLPSWPTNAWRRPAEGRITSGFGYRTHPILGGRRLHTGIDIGAPHGSPVYAAATGEVLAAERRGGYGNTIILLHGDGVQTLYAHLSRFIVRRGQRVQQGEVIGYVGATGLATGPHLHFEVRKNGQPVNPMGF